MLRNQQTVICVAPSVEQLTKRRLCFFVSFYPKLLEWQPYPIDALSLVPGGVAQQDGRLIPGDRLMYVNDVNLAHASLDEAVQALKGAARGVVRIGVSKPLPVPDTSSSNNTSDDTTPTSTVSQVYLT